MCENTFFLRPDGSFWRVIYEDCDYVFTSFEEALNTARIGAKVCLEAGVPTAIKRIDGDRITDVIFSAETLDSDQRLWTPVH